MKPGDLVRVIEKNRAHSGKSALVVRLHPHKSEIADVMIDGQVCVVAPRALPPGGHVRPR